MKIQEEHIELKNGTHYFEQTFITQTSEQISWQDYDNLKTFLEVCVDHMSKGRHIALFYKDLTDLK